MALELIKVLQKLSLFIYCLQVSWSLHNLDTPKGFESVVYSLGNKDVKPVHLAATRVHATMFHRWGAMLCILFSFSPHFKVSISTMKVNLSIWRVFFSHPCPHLWVHLFKSREFLFMRSFGCPLHAYLIRTLVIYCFKQFYLDLDLDFVVSFLYLNVYVPWLDCFTWAHSSLVRFRSKCRILNLLDLFSSFVHKLMIQLSDGKK